MPYEPPPFTGPAFTDEAPDEKIYHGSCHCGAVTLAVRVPTLEAGTAGAEKQSVNECNCSFCVRVSEASSTTRDLRTWH